MTKVLFFIFVVSLVSCSTKKEQNFDFKPEPKDEFSDSMVLRKKELAKFQVEETGKETKKPATVKKSSKKSTRNKKPSKKSNPKSSASSKVKEDGKKLVQVKPKNTEESKEQVTDEKKVAQDEKKFEEYDKVSEKVWEDYKPNVYIGEEFKFQITFLSITAGYISLTTHDSVRLAGKDAFHFSARLKSAKYYDFVYSLDDSLHSYISKDKFLPLKYTLKQRESGQKVDDLQLFDHDKNKTFYFYKRLKKGKTKEVEKVESIPKYMQDSFSALYFMRGFALNKGDVYNFPIITRAKMWLLKAEVAGLEEVKVMGKWVKAIKIKAETRFPGVLSKKGDIIFYYSNDPIKKLLKFKAKVKIGSIEGVLVDFKEGRKVD